jgi:hypothetical protein
MMMHLASLFFNSCKLFLAFVALTQIAPTTVVSYEICSKISDGGNGICPTGNTCCRMPDGGSGCISSDMGKLSATCCTDDGGGNTGCPPSYQCSQLGIAGNLVCVATGTSNHRSDALTRILPRYKLCNASGIETVHGLTVSSNGNVASLAYYSTHGPIEQIANASSIDMVLIAMHGASRNADDYFCAAKATIELQTRFSDVLLIAPSFYSSNDNRTSSKFLYWDSEDTDGTWRFGADSMGPIEYSSFDALDHLVETIQKQFPNLQQLTLAGHSSGGQVVQRWSLLTTYWTQENRYNMHSVVANPSNYVYLTSERFIDGAWKVPSTCCGDCPDYNKWEWGVDAGGDRDVPYRKRLLSNATAVVGRYASRNMVYLAGGADRCNISRGAPGWCDSHGLETTCMDELQGSNRFERNSRYIASLRRLGIWEGHERIVVPGVGHDHAMMFQSKEGIEAIYYGTTLSNSIRADVRQGALS